MKKKCTLLFSSLFFMASSSFSFDWPQSEIQSDSFHTYFAQERGGLLSPSLIFSGSDEIKATDKGKVTVVLSEHEQEPDMFESTLGNAVIVAHNDNLLTVYANLSFEGQKERYSLSTVETGTSFGVCGLSGWQQGSSLLEFQVIDTKAKAYVNPRLLMPRFGEEPVLSIANVTAQNKKGTDYDFNKTSRIPSGTYRIYMDRQNSSMHYKSILLINGAIADTIKYDTLVEQKGKLCTDGKKFYTSKEIFLDNKKTLLGEITLPKGKNKITVVVSDILGKEKSLTYNIDSY